MATSPRRSMFPRHLGVMFALVIGGARAGYLDIMDSASSPATINLGKAAITSTCTDAAPEWTFATPGAVTDDNSTVRAYFHRVPATCLYSALSVPCVSHIASYPPLFYASWSNGGGATHTIGPLRAGAELEVTGPT